MNLSVPKLISPLLDGFVMGEPLSEHDGVMCCPAMKENSDDKYIVKIISVPASQVQLEALLLTGAYKNPADAMDYFKERTDSIIKEAEFLRKVSKLEGFLAYDAWQVVPMEDNKLGYLVYLLSPYKQSLEKFARRNPVTHLNAVNLGLDLCAAMAICRRAGCMCVDLKPSNIFLSEDKEFRIGDLGFVSLKNLKYATLPTGCISAYTAPELLDPMATINATADIYATGMILYQLYNNGALPYKGHAAAETYPAPANADYEISEIIMKAIAPDPKDRWQDPIAMGQALVAYMQRNGVNDVPIVPPSADLTPPTEEASPENTEEVTPAVLEDPALDETVPGAEASDAQDPEILSEETTSMLAQAEELLSHETPDLTKPQLPEEEADPQPEAPAEENEDAPSGEETPEDPDLAQLLDDEAPEEPEGSQESEDPEESDESDESEDPEPAPKKKHGWLVALLIVLILGILAAGGFGFYKYYYQQTINSLDIEPFENQVTVRVDTQMDASLLHVLCTDIYGTTQQLPLTDGQAVFTDLQPDTQYKIHLEVDGFHALVGSTSTSFSTDAVTTIPSFTAATGNEDGSVVLNFDVTGPDCENWLVSYSTGEEDPQTQSFTGHSVTITGLTVGSTYTFTLQPESDLYLVGEHSLEFTASAIVLAEDLTISDCSGGNLTLTWSVPEGAKVDSWTVRCYSDSGYNETLETSDTTATFSLIDTTKAHNIEVTASGMTQSARTVMSANPTNITSVNFDESDANKLVVTWEFEGDAPDGGWLLLYSYDNSDYQAVIRCEDARAEITPRVPGATYHITLQSASGTSVFSNTHSYTCAEAEKFTDYEIVLPYCTFNLCKTPTTSGWLGKNVPSSSFTTTFASGDSIAMVIKSSRHYIPKDTISVLYVIRDEDGNVIHDLLSLQTDVSWYDMWQGQYPYTGQEIPKVPTEAGNYTLDLYWNSQAVTSLSFTITE